MATKFALILLLGAAGVSADSPCGTVAPAPAPAPGPEPAVSTTGGLSMPAKIGIGIGAAAAAGAVAAGISEGVIAGEATTTKLIPRPTIQPKQATTTTPSAQGTPAPENETMISGSMNRSTALWLGLALLLCCLALCCIAALSYFLCGSKKKTSRKVKAYQPVPVAPEPVLAAEPEPEVFVPPLMPMAMMAAPVTTAYAAPAMYAAPVTTAYETVAAPVTTAYAAPAYTTAMAAPAYTTAMAAPAYSTGAAYSTGLVGGTTAMAAPAYTTGTTGLATGYAGATIL